MKEIWRLIRGSNELKAFVVGGLIVALLMYPNTIWKPVEIETFEMKYSESDLVYNNIYYTLFGEVPVMVPKDFVYLSFYSIVGGNLLSCGVSEFEGFAQIYKIVLFFMEEEDISILAQDNNTETYWVVGLSISKYGVYGLAIFGNRIEESVLIQITMQVS